MERNLNGERFRTGNNVHITIFKVFVMNLNGLECFISGLLWFC